MQITIEITESLWQFDLGLFNANQTAQVQRANEQGAAQHSRIMAHTPELQRTEFVPAPDFMPLTLEQYVAKVIADKEAAIVAEQAKQHDTAILAASAEDKARVAKILAQPDQVKDAIRAQVDAL